MTNNETLIVHAQPNASMTKFSDHLPITELSVNNRSPKKTVIVCLVTAIAISSTSLTISKHSEEKQLLPEQHP